MRRTFCKQIDNRSHRISVQKSTTDALLQLYGDVMQMPDGPVKQNFLEKVPGVPGDTMSTERDFQCPFTFFQFGKCYPGTPPFMPGSHKVKRKPVPHKIILGDPRGRLWGGSSPSAVVSAHPSFPPAPRSAPGSPRMSQNQTGG